MWSTVNVMARPWVCVLLQLHEGLGWFNAAVGRFGADTDRQSAGSAAAGAVVCNVVQCLELNTDLY